MLFKVLGTLAAGLLMAGAANAVEINSGDKAYATVFGRTLPPIGFVEFCARHKGECGPAGSGIKRTALTDARWKNLADVNTYVNSQIEPISDQELYAVAERWDYPDGAGDCEDYVLLKKRYLERLDFPAASLLITVVLDEIGDGHAVLMVATDRGDFVLDNRRNDIRPWLDTKYRFLKRQSQEDPRIWVALSQAGKTSLVAAARQKDEK